MNQRRALFPGIRGGGSTSLNAGLSAERVRSFSARLVFPAKPRPLFVESMDLWGSRDLDWSDRGPEQATGEISNPLFAMGPTGAHSLRHCHGVPDHSFRFRSWPPMEWLAFADSDYRLASLRLCSWSAGE